VSKYWEAYETAKAIMAAKPTEQPCKCGKPVLKNGLYDGPCWLIEGHKCDCISETQLISLQARGYA
jgi:hypothetical protein